MGALKLVRPTWTTQNAYLPYADGIRILGAFAIVVLHTSARVVESYGNISLTSWWAGNIANSATRWAVQGFIILSGSLLINPDRNSSSGFFYTRRLSRLFVPALFWFFFYFWWLNAWQSMPITANFVLMKLSLGGPYFHLYFLYVIGFMYLITPILESCIRAGDHSVVVKLSIFLLAIGMADALIYHHFLSRPGWQASWRQSLSLITFTFGFAGYYLAGYPIRTFAFSKRQMEFIWFTLFGSFVITCLGTSLLMKLSGLNSFGLFLYNNFSPVCIVMSFSVFIIIKENRILGGSKGSSAGMMYRLNRYIAPATLGIYLVHPVFVDILWKYVDILKGNERAMLHFNPWVGIPFFSAAVFTASLITTLMIQRLPYIRRIVG